jgi:hypothetical protein
MLMWFISVAYAHRSTAARELNVRFGRKRNFMKAAGLIETKGKPARLLA